MKERPILFSAPMVRAILDGRKTQTRRVVKAPVPEGAVDAGVIGSDGESNGLWWWLDSKELEWASPIGEEFRCPHGVPGDRLWVREEFSGPHELSTVRPGLWDVVAVPPPAIWFWADGNPTWGDWTRPKPSIHMPRWASRITLEIEDVRVERLNDISLHDVVAEGCEVRQFWLFGADAAERQRIGASVYRDLWISINGPQAWVANPWVFAITFRRVQ